MSPLRLSLVGMLVACTSSPSTVATGKVGTWQTAAPLPVPRANHCAAAIDDWIVVIGGNHMMTSGDFASTDEIDAAQLAPDGTLGAWQVAGHTTSPVSECNATSDGRHLYVIDGLYDDMTDDGQIFTADLDSTGHLGALTSIGALPMGVVAIQSEATVHDGTLLLMHTELPMEGNTTVTLRTPLSGALAWSTDDWNIGFRAQAEFAFTDQFALTLGGYQDTDVGSTADVFVAPIGAGGKVGAPVPQAALPMPVAFGEANAVDDWIFVTGGRAQVFGTDATSNVYAAQLAGDGSLVTWTTATALPMVRTNQVTTLVGDYLVSTGGATTGGGDANVFVAQVRF